MAEVINLRTVRKRDKRRQHDQRAQANRLAFGQTKHTRKIEASLQTKSAHDLDRHRVEIGDHQ